MSGVIDFKIILGGFALFLFGIYYMGEGLKSVAGDKLRYYIEKFTNKTWKGIFVGTLATAFIQSSSATTSIAISFVRAGLMTMKQAFGLIIGANIGTTMTALLIGFKVEEYALYFVFIGVIMVNFASKKKTKYIGQIILGFGALFFGLALMSDELKHLRDLPLFAQFAELSNDNSWLGLLVGSVITAIIQSSSAFVGIVQKLYDSQAVTFLAAVPLVFGASIGTTITAVLASLGGNRAGRRAAMLHVVFNVLGVFLFMFLLHPYVQGITWFSERLALSPMLQVAAAHIIFKLLVTLVSIPFQDLIMKIAYLLVPGEEKLLKINDVKLDPVLAKTLPSGALSLVKEQTLYMGELCLKILESSHQYFVLKDRSHYEQGMTLEEAINSMDSRLTAYLTEIGKHNIGIQSETDFIETLQTIKSIERIGDISKNIFEFTEACVEHRGVFSEHAIDTIERMYALVRDMISLSLQNFKNHDASLVKMVLEKEDELDALEKRARKQHLMKLGADEGMNEIAHSLFLDITSNIERMGDHAINMIKATGEMPLHHKDAELVGQVQN